MGTLALSYPVPPVPVAIFPCLNEVLLVSFTQTTLTNPCGLYLHLCLSKTWCFPRVDPLLATPNMDDGKGFQKKIIYR